MILNNISFNPNTVSKTRIQGINLGVREEFPLLTIGRGSYVVQLQVQSGINFDVDAGRHSIQIGQFCSIADDVTFMVNLNHDYNRITTAASSLTDTPPRIPVSPVRAQILIQNDVWIGHGTTVMGGVTLHNGAVIAANSHIVKDVPPYAIVGGNPAKVIKYRFSDAEIADLLCIQWWDWDDAFLRKHSRDFDLPIAEFCGKYKNPRFNLNKKDTDILGGGGIMIDRQTELLLCTDYSEPHSVWRKVVGEFCKKFGGKSRYKLKIYIPSHVDTKKHVADVEKLLKQTGYYDDNSIVLSVGTTDEAELFAASGYWVTTRAIETVRRSCLADFYGTKMISGVDYPLFHEISDEIRCV